MTAETSRTSDEMSSPGPRWRPDWLKKPTGEDLAWAYPERAGRLGVSGKAKMECAVAPNGRLMKCKLIEESPAGMGFGEAALALAPHFQMTSPPPGQTGPAEVTIPLVFSMPTSDEGETSPGPTIAPLATLVTDGRDWLTHNVKPPSQDHALMAMAVLAIVLIGYALRRWARRGDGKDLSGPNSERR